MKNPNKYVGISLIIGVVCSVFTTNIATAMQEAFALSLRDSSFIMYMFTILFLFFVYMLSFFVIVQRKKRSKKEVIIAVGALVIAIVFMMRTIVKIAPLLA